MRESTDVSRVAQTWRHNKQAQGQSECAKVSTMAGGGGADEPAASVNSEGTCLCSLVSLISLVSLVSLVSLLSLLSLWSLWSLWSLCLSVSLRLDHSVCFFRL